MVSVFFPQFSQMSFPDDFWPVSAFPFAKVLEKKKNTVETWAGLFLFKRWTVL